MQHRARRRRDGAAGRWIKLSALWGFSIASVCGFGAGVLHMATQPPDAYALCQRSSTAATATMLVILDPTDKLNDTQRARLKAAVEGERDRLPKGGRMIILSLNPADPWQPNELASVCNPGTAAEADARFETLSRIEDRWRMAYAEPIERAIEAGSNGPTSPTSPIIITIASVLARPDFDRRVSRRGMLIVSDLLENDPAGYSQLKGGDFWGSYRSSRLAHTAKPDLGGVAVLIDYLFRGEFARVQGEKHLEFWERWLRESGASEVTVIGRQVSSFPPKESKPAEKVIERSRRK